MTKRSSREARASEAATEAARTQPAPRNLDTMVPVIVGVLMVAGIGGAWLLSGGSRSTASHTIARAEGDGLRREDEPEAPGAPGERTPPHAPTDVASPPPNSQRAASGLSSRVLHAGTGTQHPTRSDRVLVEYTGWTTDGHMFDSSLSRDEPAQFPVAALIPGFTEGLTLMVEGEERRLWIPESLAYGGRPGMPSGMLVFDVHLIRIVH